MSEPWQARPARSSPIVIHPDRVRSLAVDWNGPVRVRAVARETGLEPATSGVTGRRSNQLSYSRFGGGEALGREPGCVKRETVRLRQGCVKRDGRR